MAEPPEGWVLHEHSWHFHRRLGERAGIRLDHGEHAALCRAIRKGRADGKRSGYYAVPFRGGTLLVFWAGGLVRMALAVRPTPTTSSRPTRTWSPRLAGSDVMSPSPDEGGTRRHIERDREEMGYRCDRIESRLRVMEDAIGRTRDGRVAAARA
jgi:hypothetical protein